MRQLAEMRVLVVDDEPDIREFLASVLADAGMQVATAGDGAQALESIRAQPPDLISLDLVMPSKSGIRLLHDLRRDPALAAIPVLIVTGHARDPSVQRDVEQALAGSALSEAGALLEKPVTARGYLVNACRMLGIEPPPDEDAEAARLRATAHELLEAADAETLARVLDRLRPKSSES
jgi:CheY-like chemotaxis protein